MTETVSTAPNIPKPWQQELKPHPEGHSILRPEESLALMGSWVEQKIEDTLKGLTDQPEAEQERQTRVLRAALGELPSLDAQFSVPSAIGDRKALLEAELKENRSNVYRQTELRTRLAGLDFLLGEHDAIEDNIKLSGQTSKERSKYVNDLIAEHNQWATCGTEVAVGSSDDSQTQDRIKAHYEEQANQSQPNVTVADARQKVAESFGRTAEADRQALIAEIARAARGATRIYTDIPSGVQLKSKDGDHQPRGGFNSFGDGLSPDSSRFYLEKLEDEAHVEAFLVEADTTTQYKTVTETIETGGRFKRKAERVDRKVPNDEVTTMTNNPVTGQQEPGIKVSYQFNGNQVNGSMYTGPEYRTESGRGGNMLFVEATLPKSVADKLQQGVSQNPNLSREFARVLCLHNGISEEVWDHTVRPPYDELPDGWELAVTDLQKDTQYGDVRHSVTSRLNVKFTENSTNSGLVS